MRVVFVDFDGVLNTPFMKNDEKISCGEDDILNNSHAISNLNVLCKRSDLEVVVSSSWRTKGIQKIREILYNSGLDKEIKVQGLTPFFDYSTFRGKEIDAYLKDRPSITDYLILDDDSDFNEEQKEHLVKCNSHYGFQIDEYRYACTLID